MAHLDGLTSIESQKGLLALHRLLMDTELKDTTNADDSDIPLKTLIFLMVSDTGTATKDDSEFRHKYKKT